MIDMIAIGGITRLTDSGLSMVDWEPVAGIIPPITNDDWQEEFNYYKQYPEYKVVLVGHSLGGRLAIDFEKFSKSRGGKLKSVFSPLGPLQTLR